MASESRIEKSGFRERDRAVEYASRFLVILSASWEDTGLKE